MNNIDRLKIGDSIGIFSPSSAITYTCPKRFLRGKEYLESINCLMTGKLEEIHIKYY